MYRIICLFTLLTSLISCDGRYLPGFNFRSFDATPAEGLAKAVEADDYDAVTNTIKANPSIIDFQDDKYGHSLIFLAVVNQKYEAAKALLDNGADISIKDYSDSADVLMTICAGYMENKCDTKLLELLLKYNPDMNSVQYFQTDRPVSLLSTAISSDMCIPFIDQLIESGADVNYTPSGKASGTPVSTAVLYKRLDVAYYLLNKKNALVPEYCTLRPDKGDYLPITITQILLENDYSSDSEQQEYKEKILAHLKALNKI